MNSLTPHDVPVLLKLIADNSVPCGGCGKRLTFAGLDSLTMSSCPTCNEKNLVPRRLDGFWLVRPLQISEMARVYAAAHEDVPHRLFTVKIAPEGKSGDRDFRNRLNYEAGILRAIEPHDRVLNGMAFGEDAGEHYLATQFAGGESLEARIKTRGVLNETEAMVMVLNLLAAVNHVVQSGFLHRDIRPENVFLTTENGAFLYNFCISAALDKAAAHEGDFPKGSPLFVAPEQYVGGESPGSEIYSIGMVLYYALTGDNYYTPKELKRILGSVSAESTLVLSRAHDKMKKINHEIGNILLRMVKRLPEHRYQFLFEVERDLYGLVNKRF